MSWQNTTEKLRANIETSPEILDATVNNNDSRYATIRAIAAILAPHSVNSSGHKFGKTAQILSEWHKYLARECQDRYEQLTSGDASDALNRKQANQDAELQTLQAIRRGVKDARRDHYRQAHNLHLSRTTGRSEYSRTD